MVVLDSRGMLTTGHNQYLQPDYLATPLPTTLDSKKSPLALLAQTCSQIGADTSSKPLLTTLEKKKLDTGEKSGSENKSSVTPVGDKLAFKPYENQPVKKDDSATTNKSEDTKRESKTPSVVKTSSNVSSASPTSVSVSLSSETKVTGSADSNRPNSRNSNTKTESGRNSTSASPIIRSGLEILQGHPKDIPLGTYKSPLGPLGINCNGCPPGLDAASALTNPAFRSPLASLSTPMLGYPPSHLSMPSPYMSYARVKTVGGGETLVPVCKDPYCTGCQYSLQSAQFLASAAGPCPSGCSQCDHQKLGFPYIPGLTPATSVSAAAAAAAAAYSQHSLALNAQRPYVCNWTVADTYCGKRFSTSDELLQHLRTHTNLSTSDSAPSLSLLNQAVGPHPLFSQTAGLHRTYPNPPLSPLSAARYHPYVKSLPGSPLTTTLLPPHPQSFAAYYPYSLYGQRLGAAVHP